MNAAGEVRLAHPSFVTDAEAGDTRLSKVSKRNTAATSNGLTSEYDFAVYKTNIDNIPIIRNEELILLQAEYYIQTSQTTEALRMINKIRNAAGLGNYSGASDKDVLINELLKQRRYSLYGECHRWVDARRYNKLNTLPIDRAEDEVWDKFPRPASEN
ncbi:MAG: RagB/SusD family nutrient uptake outer membrane protein [Saprospiraceae bacterium]|nr:RagB/SusD family nutrient uptake outer membrane protein [Saprospiraceae bacterium]